MNKKRLFVTSCLSLVTTSMSFVIRGDVSTSVTSAFHITNEQWGLILSPAFYAFAVAIVSGGILLDLVGMRRAHILSALGYIVGVALIVFAPAPHAPVVTLFDNPSTTMLYAGFLMMGLSQGLVEAVINPLVTTIHSDEKIRRLNMLHAWWPGGQIVGGLLAVLFTMLHAPWQAKLGLIAIPATIYLVMSLTTTYPPTERVASNVSTADMWRQVARPIFWVFFVCNGLAAAVELGPDQWFPKVMGALVPSLSPGAGSGVLFLVYTAGLMFVLRSWGNTVPHKSPVPTLLICSILTAAGLYWLGGSTGAVAALTAATLFGVGKTFYSPTMMGIISEQLPEGGAVLLSLNGAAGMLAVSVAVPMMGARIDKLGDGAALQMMGWLGVILAVAYTGLWLYYKARGGYRPVAIGTQPH